MSIDNEREEMEQRKLNETFIIMWNNKRITKKIRKQMEATQTHTHSLTTKQNKTKKIVESCLLSIRKEWNGTSLHGNMFHYHHYHLKQKKNKEHRKHT